MLDCSGNGVNAWDWLPQQNLYMTKSLKRAEWDAAIEMFEDQ